MDFDAAGTFTGVVDGSDVTLDGTWEATGNCTFAAVLDVFTTMYLTVGTLAPLGTLSGDVYILAENQGTLTGTVDLGLIPALPTVGECTYTSVPECCEDDDDCDVLDEGLLATCVESQCVTEAIDGFCGTDAPEQEIVFN